jgi:hypothetical protein
MIILRYSIVRTTPLRSYWLQRSMYHRYGRYGPDAWLYLRKRRLGRFARMLVPCEYDTRIRARVRLQAGERIFIVSITTLENEDEKNTPSTVLQLSGDPFGKWRERAKIAAYNRLQDDLLHYDEPSPDEQLPVIAKNLGREELKNVPGITELGKDIPELIDIFQETFVQSFRRYVQDEKARGTIKDQTTLAVRQQARLDRSLALSGEQIPVHGAIQAIRLLLEYNIPSHYFQRIEELASAYGQAYGDDKEVRRDYRSSF